MNKQILLIDDSKKIHPLVCALLAEEQVQIHSAFDGQSGVTLAKSLRPDLILLDVEMPGIDGYETCKRLKADPELFNTPVVFLTALGAPQEKVHGLELGAVDYVTKPFNPSELLARVRASLRTHHVVQLLEEKAMIDSLTGLGNKEMFKQRLNAEVALRVRTAKPLTCIALDVNDFHTINAVGGHPFADRVLQAIAKIIQHICRVEDVPCRLVGDSFVILAPNTDAAEAALLAKRLETGLAKLTVEHRGAQVHVKCTIAVAPSIDVYDRQMWERADQTIDQSRKHGVSGVAIANAGPVLTAGDSKASAARSAVRQYSHA
jgi:diguanylate cyclase (GGDEF)-like protein